MQAICTTPVKGEVELREIPEPTSPAPDHFLIRMEASAINHGDITFLKRLPPPNGSMSQHGVWGVSGAGTVVAAGAGASPEVVGRKVAVYRSLVASPDTVGTWCEVAQMHRSTCVVLPEDADALDYCGSLVNVITPFAFLQQARDDGHAGVLVTAGSSATGIAMLGVALAYGFPLVSIVRSPAAKQALVALGATHVLVQSDPHFEEEVARASDALKATAVFDGTGGDLVNRIAPRLARDSTVYSYGFLGGAVPLSFPTGLLMAGNLTFRSFSNFGTATVRDPQRLTRALAEIGQIIGRSHFRTHRGASFAPEQVNEALDYSNPQGSKAILRFDGAPRPGA